MPKQHSMKLKKWRPESAREDGALLLCRRLQENGFSAFIVGGYVRELFFDTPKKVNNDIDIATSATPEELIHVFEAFSVFDRDRRFGTIRVRHGDFTYELTSFRKDFAYQDHRRPSHVAYAKTYTEDAKRRDFTMNALYFNPVTLEIHDPTSGIEDIKMRTIRFIGNPKERIQEDYLRILRAIRFEATLGFTLEDKTRKAIYQSARFLGKVAHERIRDELNKIIMSPVPGRGFQLLRDYKALKFVLPELDHLVGVRQDPEYHAEGDVFTHSILSVNALDSQASESLRWATLLHDMGKVSTTRKIKKQGTKRITAYNHDVVGEQMVRSALGPAGLPFSTQFRAKVRWLIGNHMKIYQLPEMKTSKQMKFVMHKWFSELLELYKADNLGRSTSDPDPLKAYHLGKRLLREAERLLGGKTLEAHLKTIVTGEDVKRILGIDRGPRVGSQLREIRELFFQEKIRNRQDALKFLEQRKAYLEKKRA